MRLRHRIHQLPLPTIIVLFFSWMMLAGSIVSALRQMVISFTLLKSAFSYVQKDFMARMVYMCAHIFHFVRICMVMSFSISLMFLVGLSDGPFNILLNSLASVFILEADQNFASLITGVWLRPSICRLRMEAMMKRKCAALTELIVEKNLHIPMECAVWAYFSMFVVLVPLTFGLQRRQSMGNLPGGSFQLSDDGFYSFNLFELCVPLALICCVLANAYLAWQAAEEGGFWFHVAYVVVIESFFLCVIFYFAILAGIQFLLLSGKLSFCFHGWHANEDGTELMHSSAGCSGP